MAQARCTRMRASSTLRLIVRPGLGRFGTSGLGMPMGEEVGVSGGGGVARCQHQGAQNEQGQVSHCYLADRIPPRIACSLGLATGFPCILSSA